jgi:hypothetical protein
MKSTAWNIYSIKPENSRAVITAEYESNTVTETLNKMGKDAAKWNKGEKRENMKIHMISCEGYVRNV